MVPDAEPAPVMVNGGRLDQKQHALEDVFSLPGPAPILSLAGGGSS